MEMREYEVDCWNCHKIIKVEMENGDKRRTANKFFVITCPNCKREWHTKIFEKMVIYPFMLMEKKEGET